MALLPQGLSPDELQNFLSAPPFVTVEGVMNIRTIAAADSYTIDHANSKYIVKPFHIFRSAELSRITDTGKEQLRALGVQKIFDLRSDYEITNFQSPLPDIEGVEVVRLPSMLQASSFEITRITELLKQYKENAGKTFIMEYSEMLEHAGPAFNVFFMHLRDHSDQPCLVNCTAGKDRTGLFSAMVLMLLGVSDEDIAKDYALTTFGLEPFAPILITRFENHPIFKLNWEGFLNMGSAKTETMLDTLKVIRETYGGAAGYLKERAGLNDEDVAKIRGNLLVTKN